MNDDPNNTNSGQAPGSNLTPTHGVWLVIGTAFGLLVAMGVIFRRGPVSE
jgi:hypothetical protein